MQNPTIAVIGGGAAGFFSAINAAIKHPHASVHIFEKSNYLLTKVKISGGGRCNVTHNCFDPKSLTSFYPRGHKELLSPFHQFNPTHTIEWFKERGVSIVPEPDGRMFPSTNTSETIINTFLSEASRLNIQIHKKTPITSISHKDGIFTLNDSISANALILTTGGGPSNSGHALAKSLGHSIILPVPSLFTFNINHPLLKDLPGISFKNVSLHVPKTKLQTTGPLLITHWGLSGPAILKLSAWGAKELHSLKYIFNINVNFLPNLSLQNIIDTLSSKDPQPLLKANPFDLPKRFWQRILEHLNIPLTTTFPHLSKAHKNSIAQLLHNASLPVHNKSTNKDEFVTAGGITLKEVNFKTMQSKLIPNLAFAGEVLNIDGITGGFNFQAAWATSFIASQNLSL